MACGFGACFGCVVPRAGGGYLRVCVDGPVVDIAAIAAVHGPAVEGGEALAVADAARTARSVPRGPGEGAAGSGPQAAADLPVELCGLRLAHPVINASGTYDVIAAQPGLRRRSAAPLPLRCLCLQDDHASCRAAATPRRGCGRRRRG